MKNLRKIAAVAVGLLLLTGCGANGEADSGSEPSAASGPSKENPVTIKYGAFSTGTNARQVLVAQELGYFEEEGVKLETTTLMSTAALGSLLASGELDISVLTYQPAFDALAAGIDIKMLAGIQALQPGMQTIYVKEDSGINSLKDLKGKKFGVSSVGGYGELLLAESLKEVGMSIDDVTLTEVAPPETVAALERGDIDAGHLASPFSASVIINPESPLTELYDFHDTKSLQGFAQGGFAANGPWLEKNSAAADAFMRAVDKAAKFLEADPEKDYEYLAKLGKLKPELVRAMPLETWVGDSTTTEDLQHVLDVMDQNGLIKKDSVDLESFVSYIED